MELAIRVDVKVQVQQDDLISFFTEKLNKYSLRSYVACFELGKKTEKPHYHFYFKCMDSPEVKFETFKKRLNKALREEVYEYDSNNTSIQYCANVDKYLTYMYKDGDVFIAEGLDDNYLSQIQEKSIKINEDVKMSVREKLENALDYKNKHYNVDEFMISITHLYMDVWNKGPPQRRVMEDAWRTYLWINKRYKEYLQFTRSFNVFDYEFKSDIQYDHMIHPERKPKKQTYLQTHRFTPMEREYMTDDDSDVSSDDD